ncbi:MAG: class II glutamine amidotransferase, partial [Desulfobacterales bacterium]|nr:class II glutamine amidotransferase [Desulfobacterales bacterium]
MINGQNGPKHACGVFAIHKHPEAAKIIYFGLYALQHRGQESAGIAVVNPEKRITVHKGMGLVPEIFCMDHLNQLKGCSGIGHVRYSTTGGSILINAQPFAVNHRGKGYAVAHNGNLVNAFQLKKNLEETGSIFQTTMDSEIFLHLFVKNLKLGLEEAILKTVVQLEGAYSFVVLTSRGEIVAIKDPNGFRPLCIGKLDGQYVVSSETCA